MQKLRIMQEYIKKNIEVNIEVKMLFSAVFIKSSSFNHWLAFC